MIKENKWTLDFPDEVMYFLSASAPGYVLVWRFLSALLPLTFFKKSSVFICKDLRDF